MPDRMIINESSGKYVGSTTYQPSSGSRVLVLNSGGRYIGTGCSQPPQGSRVVVYHDGTKYITYGLGIRPPLDVYNYLLSIGEPKFYSVTKNWWGYSNSPYNAWQPSCIPHLQSYTHGGDMWFEFEDGGGNVTDMYVEIKVLPGNMLRIWAGPLSGFSWNNMIYYKDTLLTQGTGSTMPNVEMDLPI